MSDATWDVIVIGGGVNGTGVARDCSLRGAKVALFEKNDIGFGASGNSSGMIHGGPRYLTKDPQVTYTSCLDSGHIQAIAPHLLFRVPFLVPVLGRGAKAAIELATYDAFFEVYDRYQHLKRGQKHLRFSGEEVSRLEPGLIPSSGAVSFDEWGIDGVRLCVSNLKDAEQRGAAIFNHSAVTGYLRGAEGRVLGVTYRNGRTGEMGALSAKMVVNATGAWAPLTTALGALPASASRLRPGKGIHVFLERRLSNFAVVTYAIDGRQVFLLPWQNMSVLGTTDDDFSGDLDDVIATGEEVRYLRQAVGRVLPAVHQARAIGTWGGVRPTLFQWGPHEDALSRDHKIIDHRAHGAPGLFSMLGGKLASYRLFAEEMTDIVAQRLDLRSACQTHRLPLPGGDASLSQDELRRLALEFELDALTVARLYFRHGTRIREILETSRSESGGLRIVCSCEPVIAGEVRHVIRHEWAKSVDDVSRRTRLGLGSCGGMRCALECGRLVAKECDQSPKQGIDSAIAFLRGALRRRLPAMGPEQARQEALLASHLSAQMGVELPVTAGGSPRAKGEGP